jgi:predicted transposase YbfD/YdcC
MRCIAKKTFEAAKQGGNALLAQVKGNQPGLLEALRRLAAEEPHADRHQTVDRKRHGRQEHRDIETFDLTNRLGPDWDGLITTTARITRLTWHKDTKSGLWHKTEEVSFYVSQIPLGAKDFADAVRAHWAIENRNHHVRDVTFREDDSRIRIKPGHFARLRGFALNILRANGVKNIANELYINALSLQNLLEYPLS